MSRFGRRVLAVVVGMWLLVTAAIAVISGYRVLVALLTDGSLPSVLVVAVVLALVFGYLSYRLGSERLLGRLDASPLSKTRAPRIYAGLDTFSERMGIDPPDVYVANLGQPNAFAVGSGALAFDRSLVRLLTPVELEAILAHELAHLEGHDTLVQTVATSLLRTATGLALVVFAPLVLVFSVGCWGVSLLLGRPLRGPHSVASGPRRAAVGVLMSLVTAPTAALRAYSRRREYAADDRAVAVIDDLLALARALRKIQRATEPGFGLLSWVLPDRERTPVERAFATHPPTDDRIERVREAARARGVTSESAPDWRRIKLN